MDTPQAADREADIDSLLSDEELSSLGGDPRKPVMRLLFIGAIIVAAASTGSWLWRTAATTSAQHADRVATLGMLQSKAGDASAAEIMDLGREWVTKVGSGRQEYESGSKRRREFDVACATSGVALSAAILETLSRPESLDLSDELQLAGELHSIASDTVVQRMGRLDKGAADRALVRVIAKAGDFLRNLPKGSSAGELFRASAIASQISAIAPGEDFRNFADSLRTQAGRMAELETSERAVAPESVREEAATAIKEYLRRQGIAVTYVGAEGPGRSTLVIKGVSSSKELSILLTGSPQAISRLKEAGFTEVRSLGSVGGEEVFHVTEPGR